MTSDVAPGGSVIASECVLELDSLDSRVPRATARFNPVASANSNVVYNIELGLHDPGQ